MGSIRGALLRFREPGHRGRRLNGIFFLNDRFWTGRFTSNWSTSASDGGGLSLQVDLGWFAHGDRGRPPTSAQQLSSVWKLEHERDTPGGACALGGAASGPHTQEGEKVRSEWYV